MASFKVGSGFTTPGGTNWQPYTSTPGQNGIFVKVSTEGAGFTSKPVYVTSLGEKSSHWLTTGASSVYNATAKEFTIFIRFANNDPLAPDFANHIDNQWHVNWIGIEG